MRDGEQKMITESKLKAYFLPFIALLVLGPLACNFSSAGPTPNPLATQAAGTVAAELTKAVGGDATDPPVETLPPTPNGPTDTPTPSPPPTIPSTANARLITAVPRPDKSPLEPGSEC